jgi:probable phosphoglycerate mutase
VTVNLVLVRHGETIWHAGNRYAGRSDIPLTAKGRRQAEQLGDWAQAAALDGVWCSTLDRARTTARIVAGAIGLPVHEDARLCELDFGEAEGLTTADMESRFPERLAAFRRDPVAGHLPGGEDPRAAVVRARACFDDIGTVHPDGRVMVVMHTTLVRLCLCQLMGVPLREYRRLFPSVRNCAVTEIRVDGETAAMLEFNSPTTRE